MTSKLRTLLFATALAPVAAFAQDATTTTPGQNQDPLVVQPDAGNAPAAQGGVESGTETTIEGQGSAQTDPAMQPQDPATGTAQGDPALQPQDPATGTAQGDPALQPLDPATGTAQTDPSMEPAPADDATVENVPVTTTSEDMTASAGTGETFVTVPPTGAWRVADLEGKDVYGADGEDIGEINDVIVGQDGRVLAVIVGVGGFLGIGEKDVAVAMTALQFGPGMTEAEAEAMAQASGGASATGEATLGEPEGATETGAVGEVPEAAGEAGQDMAAAGEAAVDVEIGEDALPNRIVLNVTKEQLEEAPAFEGIRGPNVESEQIETQPLEGQPVQQ